jgi:glycosyltransferase involved in cell wall biosynthesis
LVGDGPFREECETMIQENNLKNIHLLGYRHDVDEIIQIFDISALTSLWEGLPRFFPESMAAGKPIVATKVDGAPEAIKNGVNGFILPIHSPKKFAEKIKFLLNEPKKRVEMGENGKILVKKFSLSTMLKEIEILYDEQISKQNL